MKELTRKEKARKERILKSLINWKDRPIHPIEPFSVFFSKHAGFKFKCYYKEKTDFTVYLGLDLLLGNRQLVAHIIPECEDNSDQAFAHVLTQPVMETLDFSHIIDKEEAIKRIKCWENNSKQWMEQQQGELFKAISIPFDDFETGENVFRAYFGLKEVDQEVDGVSVTELEFDLILYRVSQGVYLDTVHLIPPLPAGKKLYILAQIPAEIALF
jgi:hypothetical protein